MVALLDNRKAVARLVALLLPLAVSAKMRGVVSDAEKMFPTTPRQLMSDMGGGGDCPSADVSNMILRGAVQFLCRSTAFITHSPCVLQNKCWAIE